MGKKLTTILLSIPYRRAGNVIHQQPVNFDVYDDDDHYTLLPLLDTAERELAGLPAALHFVCEDGKPVSLRGKKDGNLHVIEEAFTTLQESGVAL